MTHFKSLILAATLACGTAAPALAQDAAQSEFYFVVDRSDISGERGAQEIYAELLATAGEYCAQFGDAAAACSAQMVELAITEIADAELTEVHARVTARDARLMTASYTNE